MGVDRSGAFGQLGIPLRARVATRVCTERGRLYVTLLAPSPKFLFATYECKKNGCCLFLDENASGLTTTLKRCDLTKRRVVYP